MESDLETIAERMREAAKNAALDIGTAWNLLAEGADEIERLRHRIAGLIELQGRDSKELRALCEARDEARRDRTALRSMVDQQNAALNDAASEIERLLAVQCERDELRARIAAAPVAIMDTREGLGVCAPTEDDFPALYALQGKRVRLVAEDEG